MESGTDHGTVLPANAAAVIFNPDAKIEDERWVLMTPNWKKDDNGIVAKEIVMLAAFFARVTTDPEFASDLYDWFEKKKKG